MGFIMTVKYNGLKICERHINQFYPLLIDKKVLNRHIILSSSWYSTCEIYIKYTNSESLPFILPAYLYKYDHYNDYRNMFISSQDMMTKSIMCDIIHITEKNYESNKWIIKYNINDIFNTLKYVCIKKSNNMMINNNKNQFYIILKSIFMLRKLYLTKTFENNEICLLKINESIDNFTSRSIPSSDIWLHLEFEQQTHVFIIVSDTLLDAYGLIGRKGIN